jgi:hypothetical protein
MSIVYPTESILKLPSLALVSVIAIALNCQTALGKSVSCQIKLNDSIVSRLTVKSNPRQKVSIGNVEGVSAYLTERGSQNFEIEAFIARYDLRIYAQGSLKTATDHVIASLWGRDSLVDIESSQQQSHCCCSYLAPALAPP